MSDSRFSSLIYRIIGMPERWHDDYLDIMHEVLDDTESFDVPDNFSELAIGNQILSQLKQSNEALNAFDSLLGKSRFKMIILDDRFDPVYHNQSARELFNYLTKPYGGQKIRPGLVKLIQARPAPDENNKKNTLVALDFFDPQGEQIYLRTIRSRMDDGPDAKQFHFLMALDEVQQQANLNAELIARYQLTEKEQKVLQRLIHGKSIKQIAETLFVSENTVKTHLKAIFRKTDTNSQTAVVGLILTHEAQILDSYFEIDTSNILAGKQSADKEVVLAAGEKIVYREYGPANGQVVLVFHSGYGCRLSVPLGHEAILEKYNIRLIIPDRPGVGKTPKIDEHPSGWNQRLTEFLNILQINDYYVLGNVISSQMAVDYAVTADNRLKGVVLTSPVVVNRRAHTKYLTGILSRAARLVRASPRVALEIYELWLKSVTLNLRVHYRSMLENSIGSAERHQFEQDGTIDRLVEVFREGASRNLDGIAKEMVHCMQPMNHAREKLTFPITFWYGSEDQRLSLEGVQAIAADFENHTLHIRKGYSEYLYYSLFEEVIAAIADNS